MILQHNKAHNKKMIKEKKKENEFPSFPPRTNIFLLA